LYHWAEKRSDVHGPAQAEKLGSARFVQDLYLLVFGPRRLDRIDLGRRENV